MTTIQQELEQIRDEHDGFLPPHAVVEFARNPRTALHESFEWDDGEAAEKYRLWQARHVIRVHVHVLGGDKDPVRTYVSLLQDRHPGGGYRHIESVMTDKSLRQKLLDQALREAEMFRRKYQQLDELSGVFDEINRAKKRRDRSRRTKKSSTAHQPAATLD